jgi:hypothetical protein
MICQEIIILCSEPDDITGFDGMEKGGESLVPVSLFAQHFLGLNGLVSKPLIVFEKYFKVSHFSYI